MFLRLTIMKSFKTEELGINSFMMSFYIEESRDKPLDVVCGVQLLKLNVLTKA